MTRKMCVLFLCIVLLFVFILVGCSIKSQNVTQKATLNTQMDNLPPVEVMSKNKIIPNGGISLDEIKALVVEYLIKIGVKGDIKSNLLIDDITIKEAWENLGVQLFNVKLDYASIYGVVIIKDGKVIDMVSGMPLFEVFLADIDQDTKYEIYANVAFGSGIVSDDISGYNFATNTKYYVSRRTEKDFKLFIKDNKLLVKETPYGNMKKGIDTLPEIKTLKIVKDKLELEKIIYGFAVYKVNAENFNKSLPYGKETNVLDVNGKKIMLSEIEIEDTPIFTDQDIEKYNWDTNTITLNADFLKKHPLSQKDIEIINEKKKQLKDGMSINFYGGSRLLNCSDTEAAIITIGEERIYALGFALPAWSSRWQPNYIEDIGLNSIRIRCIAEAEKLIKDKRIHDFFEKEGKLGVNS